MISGNNNLFNSEVRQYCWKFITEIFKELLNFSTSKDLSKLEMDLIKTLASNTKNFSNAFYSDIEKIEIKVNKEEMIM